MNIFWIKFLPSCHLEMVLLKDDIMVGPMSVLFSHLLA